MLRLFYLLTAFMVRAHRVALRSRSELVLENVALRQEVGVLTKRRSRPRLDDADRAFWVAMRCAWRSWAGVGELFGPRCRAYETNSLMTSRPNE